MPGAGRRRCSSQREAVPAVPAARQLSTQVQSDLLLERSKAQQLTAEVQRVTQHVDAEQKHSAELSQKLAEVRASHAALEREAAQLRQTISDLERSLASPRNRATPQGLDGL